MLDVLEARLTRQKHLLGADYSLADLIVASVIGYGAHIGQPVDAHPHIKAWLEAFQKREAYQITLR